MSRTFPLMMLVALVGCAVDRGAEEVASDRPAREAREVPYEAVPTAASTPTSATSTTDAAPVGTDPTPATARDQAVADGRQGEVLILRGQPGAEEATVPANEASKPEGEPSLGGARLASDLEHDTRTMRTWVDAQDYEPGEATADAVASIARDLAAIEAQTDALAELPETERDAGRQRIEARAADLRARIERIDEGWDL